MPLNLHSINYLQAKDKLEILYSQMAMFMDPLYLAFFFEDAQGPTHRRLASVLEMTSYFLNDTVLYVKRQVRLKKRIQIKENSKVFRSEDISPANLAAY